MISVNTNQGAMVALQTLNRTNDQMAKTQNAIATGLKVASAKDNGALFAIANKMRSDVTAYDRVRESADRATAILDTGIAAGESIMELLNEMKGKALAGTQAGNSASAQSALDADFIQLRNQIVSIVENASFDGANMIRNFQANGTTANTVNDAISLGDAAGGNNITIAGAGMQLRATTAAVAGGEIMRFGQDQTISSTANATTAVGLVNTTIDNLGTRLATWGAGAKRLDVHRTFIGKLQDALNNGIGAIVDADLAKESAKLQALQVKQQLGVQALSIANGSSQTALSLFR
ncbi:flagellin [Aquidulcibacter sp.]|uniref:flagellin N-terminal helical domain-containing protein n=1 Tax=Aquidulcibacter sp. TaxID=2052990 RepID=UPI003BA6FAC7